MDISKLSKERILELQDKFPPLHAEVKPEEMILLHEGDYSSLQLQSITCVNHPKARYMSKDPWQRNLHFIQGPNGLGYGIEPECECPFSDLRLVKE